MAPQTSALLSNVLFFVTCSCVHSYSTALNVRKAVLSDRKDAAAICDVRAPTQYVVEDGTVGFMGQKVSFDPETAHKRRVEARLGTAIRDKATVLIATDESAANLTVIGTADLIPLAAGRGRRVTDPELPARLLLRNLWVAEAFRRQGVARELMGACVAEALEQGVSLLSLEVDRDNEPAIALYLDLGFEELEPPAIAVPKWLRGVLPPLVLVKELSA